jgi:hypothetical protein
MKLQETLNGEGEADRKLNSIAERHVNIAAAHVCLDRPKDMD